MFISVEEVNTIDLYGRVCVPSKVKVMNLKVFNVKGK